MITQIRKKDKIIISVRHGVSSTCVKKKKGKKTEKRGKSGEIAVRLTAIYVYYMHLKRAPNTRVIQEKQQEKC